MSHNSFYPKAVLFDMDGLMLDTERPIIELWLESAREHGWEIDREIPTSTVGLNEAGTREKIMAGCGKDFPYDSVRKRLYDLYKERFSEKGPDHRPGLMELLDVLKEKDIPLAVATSTSRDKALERLAVAGILDRFKEFACGDEIANGKPAPDIFLLAASRLGVSPDDCIGFEDSPAGLQSLAAAGIRSVFIKDIVEPPREILSGVWKRFDNLAEAKVLFT